MLVRLASACTLFHSPERIPFISVKVDKHVETYPLDSEETRQWLRLAFLRDRGRPANEAALATALNSLAARAIYEGETHPVHLRVAAHEGSIYLDLANKSWQAVKITPTGWEIRNQYPVRFRRPAMTETLPYPASDGDVRDLRRFLNVKDEESWVLLIGWLVGSLRPKGPYPMLEVHGPQGAAKSSACRVIRSLIDPNKSPLRSKPKTEEDLFVTAGKGWVCGFDNLSGIPEGMSDALCRVATGGGFSKRKLYSDDAEFVIDVMRPILINGIGDQATRPDLLDRTITVPLEVIHDAERRDEETFYAEFAKAAPSILGGLIRAVSCALANIETVKLPSLPRMADFTKWVTAAEPALGWKPLTFLNAYNANRDEIHVRALEAEPLVPVILGFMEGLKDGRWQGTATELLDQLREIASWRNVRLPGSASELSRVVTRFGPTLTRYGVSIRMRREADRRLIEMERRSNAVTRVTRVSEDHVFEDEGEPQGG